MTDLIKFENSQFKFLQIFSLGQKPCFCDMNLQQEVESLTARLALGTKGFHFFCDSKIMVLLGAVVTKIVGMVASVNCSYSCIICHQCILPESWFVQYILNVSSSQYQCVEY